jgi:hypothetical protein
LTKICMPDMLAWFLLVIHYAGHVVKTQVARANGERVLTGHQR